jgi:hypothetical protein
MYKFIQFSEMESRLFTRYAVRYFSIHFGTRWHVITLFAMSISAHGLVARDINAWIYYNVCIY